MRLSHGPALPALVLALGALAAGCGSNAGTRGSNGTVHVVAGENVWGDVVRQIGGSHVTVTSIITDPDADPHSYESDPADAGAVARADLVVENGAGYDEFLAKLVGGGTRSGRTVLTLAEALGVNGSNPNPHLWYSPTYVAGAAHAIAAALSAKDPADAASFQAGAAAFLRGYQPYVDTLATIRARYGGTAVAYTERVPGYLLDAAGLRLGIPTSFAQAVEDGDDPSPADTLAFDSALARHAVRVLLYNGQVTDDVTDRIKELAATDHVPVVGVTETIPAGQRDFQTWQLNQARAVLAALGG